jgi:hypothetical protein
LQLGAGCPLAHHLAHVFGQAAGHARAF